MTNPSSEADSRDTRSPETPPTVQNDEKPWTVVSNKNTRRNGRHGRHGRHGLHKQPMFMDFDATHSISPREPAAPVEVSRRVNDADGKARVTIAHIQKNHDRIVALWQANPYSQRLKNLITSEAANHVPVTMAVCLGAGTFGGKLDGGEHIRRSHIQTHVFLSIVDCLEQYSGEVIQCFFQEPLYTDADKLFIRELGHEVVEQPTATKMVTSSTLVFGIHLPNQVYLDCLSSVFPAMLIGTSYDKYEEMASYWGKEGVALDNLQRVDSSFSRFGFPHDRNDFCFSDTSIYWNKPVEETTASADFY